MRAWLYEFKGIWLTGYGVIVAATRDQAEGFLEAQVYQMKLDSPPRITREIDLTQANSLTVFNGDY